jgi:hypothetical protein
MRRRLPLFVLLASALTFLVSLYLPWQQTLVNPGGPADRGSIGLLNLLYANESRDGWTTDIGYMAALLAIALSVAGAAALTRPRLARTLPVTALGIGLAYFAAGLVLQLRADTPRFGPPGVGTFHYPWSYGAYVGVASAGVAALCGLVLLGGELLRPRATLDVIRGALCVSVFVSFLLPWTRLAFGVDVHGTPGLSSTAVTIAALALGVSCTAGAAVLRSRLPLALVVAILCVAAASAIPLGMTRVYGMWIGVGCSVSIAALEALRAWPWQVPAMPRGWVALRTGAAALLVVALFLPWLGIAFGLGAWQVTHGWEEFPGAVAGGVALLLLAAPAIPVLEAFSLELVAAIAFFVSWVGAGEASVGFPPGFRVGYGSFLGFAATLLLIVSVLVPLRPAHVERKRALAYTVPIAASVACLGVVVVGAWEVLPWPTRYEAVAVLSWFSVAALLLSLYLIHTWVRRMQDPSARGDGLVLVPLVLLVLPTLQLIRARHLLGVTLGGWILVGLCLALAAAGWIDQSEASPRLRVPGGLRIDRLPETEG